MRRAPRRIPRAMTGNGFVFIRLCRASPTRTRAPHSCSPAGARAVTEGTPFHGRLGTSNEMWCRLRPSSEATRPCARRLAATSRPSHIYSACLRSFVLRSGLDGNPLAPLLVISTVSRAHAQDGLESAGPAGYPSPTRRPPQPMARHVPLIRTLDQPAWLPGSARTAGR